MPRLNPRRPFVPDPAQMALAPPVSGNAINGLGEAEVRPPRVVYWASDPATIPHGEMQRWFYGVDPGNPLMAAARADRAARIAFDLPDVTGPPAERRPEEWTEALAALMPEADVDMVGVAAMDPAWVYAGETVAESRIVMLGVRHDYEEIASAPDVRAGAECIRQYGRAMAGAKRVAAWLRLQGWAAEPQTGPMTGKVAMVPAAIACGFGELGKHGSIINPEFGASFRLSAVLTDAPFAPTPARAFGIDDFCMSCRICEEACPPEAIGPVKQLVRGTEKWYVDFDRCLPFFNEHQGCSICIAVCPWSRPGVGPSLARKLARRAGRQANSAR
jgi:ferredoxin